jgi:hypothetical protein
MTSEPLCPKFFESLPPMIRHQVEHLTGDQRQIFSREYQARARRESQAYVWWLLGLHPLYLRRRSWPVAVLYLLAGLFMVFWLVDLFRLPKMVREANLEAAGEALRRARR